MSEIDPWRGSSRARRLYERVREHGFGTLTAFANARPAVSLVALAHELGLNESAAGHVWRGLLDEAERHSQVTRFMRDVLVRELAAEFPAGWPAVMNVDNRCKATLALNRWCYFMPETHVDRAEQVREVLQTAPPRPGWHPRDPDDELLRTLLPDGEA